MKTSKGKLIVEAHKRLAYKSSKGLSREYLLPEGVKVEEMSCKYTNDRTLVVEAPYSCPEWKEQEIPITRE